MNLTVFWGQRLGRSFLGFRLISGSLYGRSFDGIECENGYESNLDSLGKMDINSDSDKKPAVNETLSGFSSIGTKNSNRNGSQGCFSPKWRFSEDFRVEVDVILKILEKDGPDFDVNLALDELQLKLSGSLVREVLIRILKIINHTNKKQCARFRGVQGYVRLVDEMIENGFPTTAQTFNILICTCGEVGMEKRLVERFIKSKTFNYRPFKHSFNAILHCLLGLNHYKLIEWVYQQMLLEGHSADILTYNILMSAKYRLGKLNQFHKLLDEMGHSGLSPDLHTYNILLHVLGKGDKPLAALNLLNRMEEVGCNPSILHFTTLIDGLSRAGNLDACKYFFDEMVNKGCIPDVICYTVMITGYIAAGELEKAQGMFDDMIIKGQLPNVYTYNSMIRGLCMAGKFEKARSMLKEMESKGCNPNFVVYSTLVGCLRNAGKLSEAHEIIGQMVEKGHYIHLLPKFKGYRRC
ncbi:hypothetical protein HHK36_026002 [Tetracentron sinense]|uniref:Pentatricopeptide repeat-containing protein n=1 Tax=Tetracentron sinense TaxID=13715 RepID=A0A834YHY3_TETSI|nr:hypothetical protein HHK36_026002 [Tetracentron sinense]